MREFNSGYPADLDSTMSAALRDDFFQKGWCVLPYDPPLKEWVDHCRPYARGTIDHAENRQWLRCGGTWFAGVNALHNDGQGRIHRGPPLTGLAVDFLNRYLDTGSFVWDRAQISICYPGYPQPMDSETTRAFRYRLNRDAAHVDGLLPEGADRRRFLREHHAFILGIPLVEYGKNAAPFVIWEGSHELIRERFQTVFHGIPPGRWRDMDITESYHDLRKTIFESCQRTIVHCNPGEAYLAHRLSLHGISPWQSGVTGSSEGRMICYFRPELGEPALWLNNP